MSGGTYGIIFTAVVYSLVYILRPALNIYFSFVVGIGELFEVSTADCGARDLT